MFPVKAMYLFQYADCDFHQDFVISILERAAASIFELGRESKQPGEDTDREIKDHLGLGDQRSERSEMAKSFSNRCTCVSYFGLLAHSQYLGELRA